MPKLRFRDLKIGDVFVAIKVVPDEIHGERIKDTANIFKKVSDTKAAGALAIDSNIWSPVAWPFDPSYRVIQILPLRN